MKTIEVLNNLAGYAGDYCQNAAESIKTNQHMNDLTEKDFENIEGSLVQKIAEAVVIDFINYIGAKNCIDYAIYTKDLPKELEKNRKARAKLKSKNEKGIWKLRGLDTFSGEPYPLPGEYPTEEKAKEAAQKRIEEFEEDQPTSQSGGQDIFGIQNRVFIIRPDGTEYRYNGIAKKEVNDDKNKN